ncbi:hypothetical protein BJ973_004537 [Actinoplanes tereljensis]|uniref:Uncharacterized protein n=1 Tax=Paractinoplanes tereljensis TaxID=571912 RepID=A0A919NU03_9ACTN|nr:hypothetical protein [Actinoplanes tereljensis]GIF23924.1 hypothetical protein Ate02nite_66540 [Actinoplanes tereljensis]
MHEELLRETLPGEWRVLASTFPMWLSGRRLRPTFTYAARPGSPLSLSDVVSYRTRSGATRRITGVDRFDARTGVFTWRGRGVLSALTSRWRVEHLSDDRELIVLTFERSLVTPAGIDVIGRGPGERPDARDRVPAKFGAVRWIG